jgi:Protein of unknown function (DUF4235)
MSKLLYKPVSLGASLVGGALAAMAFKRIWQLASGEPEPPEATSDEYGWGEVLAAAALEGAIFGLVKAAVDRGGAVGVRRLTGRWPG